MRRRAVSVAAMAAAAAALLAAACGGGDGRTVGGFSGLGDLRGKTVGVASLQDIATLELRYLLQERYGLEAGRDGPDVTLREAPAESLPELLSDGEIDAALLLNLGAFRLLEARGAAVLAHVTKELAGLTGAPAIASVFVTYPDVVSQKGPALAELNRLLAGSVAYFEANEDSVLRAIAQEQAVDEDFLRWWWERQRFPLGPLSAAARDQLRDLWEEARALGDIEEYPDPTAVAFDASALPGGGSAPGTRVTVSIALVDDAVRRTALFAIEQGIVVSRTVDLDITYLPPSTLVEAVPSRQYEVIEAPPLVIPGEAPGGPRLIVLSAGLEDTDGALLFVRTRGGK